VKDSKLAGVLVTVVVYLPLIAVSAALSVGLAVAVLRLFRVL